MTSLAPPVLQVSLFFDYIPEWLGPSLVFIGIEMILLGAVQKTLPEMFPLWTRLTRRESLVVVGGIALGTLFSAVSVLQRFDAVGLYAMLLYCLGRLISGAAAIRFYKRVLFVARHRELPGGLQGTAKRFLVVFFVFLVTGWFAIWTLERGPIYGTTESSLVLVWTGFTLVISVVGITHKLRFADDVLNRGMKTGMVLCVGGAEIYNYAMNGLNVASFIVGSIAYSVGFWLAAVLLIRSDANRRRPLFE